MPRNGPGGHRPLYWRLAVVRTPTAPDCLERLADKLLAAFAA
ncbi:hypothetical protein [Kitasatospora sp. NPDC096140]